MGKRDSGIPGKLLAVLSVETSPVPPRNGSRLNVLPPRPRSETLEHGYLSIQFFDQHVAGAQTFALAL